MNHIEPLRNSFPRVFMTRAKNAHLFACFMTYVEDMLNRFSYEGVFFAVRYGVS